VREHAPAQEIWEEREARLPSLRLQGQVEKTNGLQDKREGEGAKGSSGHRGEGEKEEEATGTGVRSRTTGIR